MLNFQARGFSGEDIDPDEAAREIFKQMFGEDYVFDENSKPFSAGVSFGKIGGVDITPPAWLFPAFLAVFFYFVFMSTNNKPPEFRMSPQGAYQIRRETKVTQVLQKHQNGRKSSSFRSVFRSIWVVISLSGHHSQFGTAANCNINVKMLLNSLLKMQR